MTTQNTVDVVLSGNTGTVNFVGSTSPTLITPTIGVATATSITFSPTTNGVIGTTAADNTTAGDVGEFITASAASPGVSLTSPNAKTVTSISLSAGDWDIWGNVNIIPAAALSVLNASISDTADTLGVDGVSTTLMLYTIPFTNATEQRVTAGRVRVSTAGQTYYLVAGCTFTSTCTAWGTICARRRR